MGHVKEIIVRGKHFGSYVLWFTTSGIDDYDDSAAEMVVVTVIYCKKMINLVHKDIHLSNIEFIRCKNTLVYSFICIL